MKKQCLQGHFYAVVNQTVVRKHDTRRCKCLPCKTFYILIYHVTSHMEKIMEEIVFEKDTDRECVDAIQSLVGCGCMLIDGNAKIKYANGSCEFCCPASQKNSCIACHKYAAYQAERFEGKYIYFCPAGFMFAIAHILEDDSRFLAAGPIIVTPKEDHISSDLTEPFSEDREMTAQLMSYIDTLKAFEPKQATYISDILLASANQLSGIEYKRTLQTHEKVREQQQINDYIQNIKSRMVLGINEYKPYPYDKEKKLSYAITTGNEADARKYLNEILGYIFFVSDNLDAIKIRAMELTVLLSRAALEGGADVDNIYRLNTKFISDFLKLDSIDDICFSLTRILNRFSEETFSMKHVKHVDLLSKAISFMRSNYMHKITLEDVAEAVYLSPSYLSKIFKDEMKTNFNSYLNSIRIEKSKILLRSEQLSIIEISELVGFFDQSYFNKVFKKLTGVTPKKYREQKYLQ